MERIDRWCVALSSVALAVIVLLTTLDVCLSNFTGRPITGVFDVVETSLVFLVFLGLPSIFRKEANITVDVIDHFVPAATSSLLRTVGSALSVLFLGVVALAMVRPATDAIRFGDVKGDSGIPLGLLWAAVLTGTSLSMVWSAIAMARTARRTRQRSI